MTYKKHFERTGYFLNIAAMLIGIPIMLLMSCKAEQEPNVEKSSEPPYGEIPLNKIGTIQFRSTEEIAGSDLWIGCEVLDRDYADYDAYKDYLPQLGAKKARLQSGWAKTEKEKGVYDFKWLDAIVDDLISKKIEPWMQISYGNPLYPGGGGISLGEGLPTSEEALQAWENYTRALVKHFQGRVSEWEIWNEADHGYNKSSGLEYANLYYRTAKVVRAVQPNAKLLALSMAGINKPKFVKDFLDFLKEKDAIHLVDVVTFHGYLANPDQGFHYIDSLKNLTHTYDPSIAFWQGETGCPSTLATSGALKQYPWSEKLQAKWSLRRALAHLGRGYPYLHFTISEYVYDRELFSGLNSKGLLKINPDKSIAYAKPAYYAYQNLTALLDHDYTLDTTFSYETKSDYHMSAFSWKHKQSGNMVAIWLDGSKPTENDWYIPLDFQFNGISFKDPVVVDTRTGEVFEFPPDQYKVSEKGTEFKNIPVYDSPLIILDRTNAPIKNL